MVQKKRKGENLPVMYDNKGVRLTRDETIWFLGCKLKEKRGELPAFLNKIRSIIDNEKRLQKAKNKTKEA